MYREGVWRQFAMVSRAKSDEITTSNRDKMGQNITLYNHEA